MEAAKLFVVASTSVNDSSFEAVAVVVVASCSMVSYLPFIGCCSFLVAYYADLAFSSHMVFAAVRISHYSYSSVGCRLYFGRLFHVHACLGLLSFHLFGFADHH